MNDSENSTDGPSEPELLALLKQIQEALAAALDSLGGKPTATTTLEARYVVQCARFVNKVVDGYWFLRQSGRFDASKVMVRPSLEVTMKARAVLRKREFFFRIAYKEWKEERKLLANFPHSSGSIDDQIDHLKNELKRHDPNYPIQEREPKIKETAEAADMLDTYNTAYALYCAAAHGALRVAVEDRYTDKIDTRTVAWAALQMLEALQAHTPATVPELRPFVDRLLNGVKFPP